MLFQQFFVICVYTEVTQIWVRICLLLLLNDFLNNHLVIKMNCHTSVFTHLQLTGSTCTRASWRFWRSSIWATNWSLEAEQKSRYELKDHSVTLSLRSSDMQPLTVMFSQGKGTEETYWLVGRVGFTKPLPVPPELKTGYGSISFILLQH